MKVWTRVADRSDCPPGSAIERLAGERIVALYNVDGSFYALDGICPHQGGPLGDGILHGCLVACPWHGWQFDVRTGQHQLNPRLYQESLPVRVEGEAVLVEVDAPAE